MPQPKRKAFDILADEAERAQTLRDTQGVRFAYSAALHAGILTVAEAMRALAKIEAAERRIKKAEAATAA